MSSGIVHARATLVVTPLTGLLAYGATENVALSTWAMAGCLSGLVLTPDLDQEGVSSAEWKIIRLTLGLGYVWLAFWGPYSVILPHRSALSHWPVISTLLRLLYLWAGVWVLGRLGLWPPPPGLEALLLRPEVRALVVGLMASDITHWLFDVVPRR